MIQKLLMPGVLSQHGVSRHGYTLNSSALSVEENLALLSEEVGDGEYELVVLRGELFSWFVELVVVKGSFAEFWGCG
jgi:hypothetical protein